MFSISFNIDVINGMLLSKIFVFWQWILKYRMDILFCSGIVCIGDFGFTFLVIFEIGFCTQNLWFFGMHFSLYKTSAIVLCKQNLEMCLEDSTDDD